MNKVESQIPKPKPIGLERCCGYGSHMASVGKCPRDHFVRLNIDIESHLQAVNLATSLEP